MKIADESAKLLEAAAKSGMVELKRKRDLMDNDNSRDDKRRKSVTFS